MQQIRRTTYSVLLLLFCLTLSGQNSDSTLIKFSQYFYALKQFTNHVPQEKIHLHFDNTSYYQGDNIWFKCYVVTSELNRPTELSQTIYVELLNPGGEVIDKRILKVKDGQCHGDFALNRIPFYSGFYEIRAYTKYMLNFGEEAIFSRTFPVFNQPKEEGNYEEKDMPKYASRNFPMKRLPLQKEKKLNLTFFPEGGNLVQGISSQVAFEATDTYGNPVDITGIIINEAKEEINRFSAIHNGRGVFTYQTPPTDKNKQQVIVEHDGKKYTFNLPAASPRGFVMKVDNLSETDSIDIHIQKNQHTPADILGLVVISRDKQYPYLAEIAGDEAIHFKIDKSKLAAGVSKIVLFNSNGDILGDRLIYTGQTEQLQMGLSDIQGSYRPYEPIQMTFTVTDKDKNPVQSPFSLSVRDGMNEVVSGQNIQTDLLLMSEIKGYVRTPSYYFEAEDSLHRMTLDHLLMIQGWHRYSWEQMIGTKPFKLHYAAEQGIEIQGHVESLVRQIPKPNVDVSFFLLKKDENEDTGSFIDSFTTDSLGFFSFAYDVQGKWNMILAVTEKGKKKNYNIILDRLFSPAPKRFQYAEMLVTLADTEDSTTRQEEIPEESEEDIEAFFSSYADSLAKRGIDEKIHRLKEVTVTAKKRSREKDILNNRQKSIAYYDVNTEIDDIKDEGKYIGDDIHELLLNINKNFRQIAGRDYLSYKAKLPLFVINYTETQHTEISYFRYKLLRLEAIKSIYINENLSTMCQYADPRMSPMDVDAIYGCAVFIETYPEGMAPVEAGKGVRKTWLEGYSQVNEFYSPDYSILQPEPDYRRTLYWNPSITPDSEGKATIQFYNNSRCRIFSISAETITSQGVIGMYEDRIRK